MRKLVTLAAAVAVVALSAAASAQSSLTVRSSAFADGGVIPKEYTCEGGNLPPPLSWSTVPPGTRSVAVVVEDPDAPGGTFEHLALFNLPPSKSSLPSTALESLGQPGSSLMAARNSGGTNGFAPICPPSGRHRYRFVVSALDTTLPLSAGAPAGAVETAMNGHVLARGVLVGTYQSQR